MEVTEFNNSFMSVFEWPTILAKTLTQQSISHKFSILYLRSAYLGKAAVIHWYIQDVMVTMKSKNIADSIISCQEKNDCYQHSVLK